MLDRTKIPELASILEREYPRELFRGMLDVGRATLDARTAGYGDCCMMYLWKEASSSAKDTDTRLLASMDVPHSTSGFLNPFAITHSNWLKKDLGLADEEGELTFLFGRASWEDSAYPTKLEFYTINIPFYAKAITDLLVICKRRNRDDRETEHKWLRVSYGDKESKTAYYRRNTDTVDGYYYVLTVYPIGFRHTETDAEGRYYFEGTDAHYRNYARFVKAREASVRKFCTMVLEAWNNGEPTDDLLPDDVARPAAEASSTAEFSQKPAETRDVATTSELSPQELCEQLNRRIYALKGQESFEGLEAYTCDYRNHFEGISFVLPTSKTRHTLQQALRHVGRLEFFARLRKQYLPQFEEMRERINAVEAILHTDSSLYAEIETPTGSFSSGEKTTCLRCFSFSRSGLKAAKEYLKNLEDECANNGDTLPEELAN